MDRFAARAAAVFASAAFALYAAGPPAITADPDHVRFSKYDDSAVIRVLIDGAPLPSEAIKNVRAMIGASDYSSQFVITKSSSGPATITLSPKEGAAQSGTFALVISVGDGNALVAIDMPLDKIPGTLEDQARQQGITVDELKAKMGLSQEGKRETLTVRLPQWQYVGSTFSLRMPASPGRTYIWKMDGVTALEGKDENAFKCVLDKPGERHIDLEVRDGETIVAQWSGVLEVIEYPEMLWQVRKDQPFTLRAPKGFKSHSWKIDGHGAGGGDTLKHTFKKAGEHLVVCTSHKPVVGEPEEFRTQTWKIAVR